MNERSERVRFCNACNAVVGWHAIHCDLCGGAIGARSIEGSPRPTPVAQMVRSSENDLFTAQMRLLHRFLDAAVRLEKAVARHGKRVGGAVARVKEPDAQRNIVSCADRVCELEQEWEELQQSYNRQAESVEEEFLARIADLESDLELEPGLQAALEEEAEGFLRILEQIQSQLAEMGSSLDLALTRSSSRFLNLPYSVPVSRALQVSILLISIGLGAYIGHLRGVSAESLLILLAAPAVGMILMLIWGRRA